MTDENNTLYDNLFLDDLEDDDTGLSRINELYDHLNFHEMSKYFDFKSYNDKFPTHNTDLLSVFHVNIRSFMHNKDELEAVLSSIQQQPDVLALSETWLTSDNQLDANINGYTSFHVVREAAHGGVSLLVRNELSVKYIDTFSLVNGDIEICSIVVSINNTDYTIACIYRPNYKYDKIPQFRRQLSQILNHPTFKKSNSILLGDFNINLLEFHSHDDTNDFLLMMQTFCYLPLITRPTRVPQGLQSGTPSLLDHVYINFTPPSVVGILHYEITDHYPVFLNFILPQAKSLTYDLKFRLFTGEHKQKFTRDLSQILWEEILIHGDLNENYNKFHSIFYDIYNRNFPVVTKSITNKKIKNPWITKTVLNLISRKNAMYRDYKLGTVSGVAYRSFRNFVNKMIKVTKNSYYIALFNNFKSKTAQLWKELNNITKPKASKQKINVMHNDKLLTKSIDVANSFNTFFAEIASRLDSELPQAQHNPMNFLSGNVTDPIQIPNVNISHIVKIIKSIKSKKCSIDNFSPVIIKENVHLIAQPLAALFNQSVDLGKFPSLLKTARITPIFKKGSKTDMNNYRPISILNLFSKIFEKQMKCFLMAHISKNNILFDNQYGFQPGKSTLDAHIKFSTEVHNQLNQSNCVLSIFVDFSKAFDTVPHD